MQEIDEKMDGEKGQEIKIIQYESPAIIYEGIISTRAGTPVGDPRGADSPANGIDLFDN